MSTALIPWNEDFKFDEKNFRDEVRHILKAGIKHVYIMGTAGEGYDVTDEEFREIVGIFLQEMSAPGLHPMVCVISQSTRQIMQRIKIAYRIGIREFQLVLPSWGVLNDRELAAYYHMICDPYPNCAFMHYNVGRSGRVLNIENFRILADEIPNLVAVKFTTPNTVIINEILNCDCPVQFFLTDMGWAYGSQIGECSYLVSVAATDLKLANRYFKAGLNHDYEKLILIERELGLIRGHLIKTVGASAMDGAYDKVCVKMELPEFPLRLRPPYEFISDAEFAKYRDYIRRNFPDLTL